MNDNRRNLTMFLIKIKYTLHLEPTACNIAIPSIVREAGIVSLVIKYSIIIIIITIIIII